MRNLAFHDHITILSPDSGSPLFRFRSYGGPFTSLLIAVGFTGDSLHQSLAGGASLDRFAFAQQIVAPMQNVTLLLLFFKC